MERASEEQRARAHGLKMLRRGGALLALAAIASSVAFAAIHMNDSKSNDGKISALLASACLGGLLGSLQLLQGVMEVTTKTELRVSGSPRNGKEQALRAVYILAFFVPLLGALYYFALRG